MAQPARSLSPLRAAVLAVPLLVAGPADASTELGSFAIPDTVIRLFPGPDSAQYVDFTFGLDGRNLLSGIGFSDGVWAPSARDFHWT